MACPEYGNKIMPYEEVWRPALPGSGLGRAWILQGQNGAYTRFLGKTDTHFFAMEQNNDGNFNLRREDLVTVEGESRWAVKYDINGACLPSLERIQALAFDGEHNWKVDDSVVINDTSYQVRACNAL